MRYYDILLGPHNATIVCLNDRDSAYELRDILKACVRTYMAVNGLDSGPSVEVLEDFNHDPDCGSFMCQSLQSDYINKALAKILDCEIDRFIKERDLWSDRVKVPG